MNKSETSLPLKVADLPVLLDLRALKANFKIGKTTAYYLASHGDIQALTMGSPGKRGKRVFLTESVLAHVQRRLEESQSKPLKCGKKKPSQAD